MVKMNFALTRTFTVQRGTIQGRSTYAQRFIANYVPYLKLKIRSWSSA